LKPFRFTPQYINVIWGGTEIASFKGIDDDRTDIGESWEVSGLVGYESVVAEGDDAGLQISQLIEKYGARLLGKEAFATYGNHFPLILKIIDAHSDLSVQVHPDDEYARTLGLPNGKTEMWYLLKTLPGSKIYAGFNRDLDEPTLRDHVEAKTLMQCVNAYEPKYGDVFYLPAGRVHAIGGGNLLVEIQQASNTTFRLYDYDRRDAAGNPRQLHVDEACKAVEYTASECSQSNACDTTVDGDRLICSCRYFTGIEVKITGERRLTNTRRSFILLTAIAGRVVVDGDTELRRGQTILVPAETGDVSLEGDGTLLAFTL
jgi:mannose-6-phosphate isomerase